MISSAIAEHHIPPELVCNVDETGLHLVPVSNWTMEKEGSQKIKIEGMDDKREVTAVVGASSTGVLLPIQILYAGKTERCHPVGVRFLMTGTFGTVQITGQMKVQHYGILV